MGNCMRSEAKVVRIMKIDGKILEYRPSITVNQVLSEFKGHSVSDILPALQYLEPDTELVGGHLYYLIPLPVQSPKVEKKKVRFSEPEKVVEETEEKNKGFTIKLVISKQELKEMLESGIVTMDGIVPNLQNDGNTTEELNNHEYSHEAWKPSLKSIPELD